MPLKYSGFIPPLRILMPTTNMHASGAGQQGSAGAQSSTNHPIAMEPCSKCNLYCALAASLYKDLVSVKNFVSTMSVAANNDIEVMSH